MTSEAFVQKKINFHVEGMHCINCIRKLQGLSKEFTDIKSLKVDLGNKTLSVDAYPNLDIKSFESRVKAEGFSIKKIAEVDQNKTQNRSQKFLTQIGVAGFCSGNIMLFSAAEYVGAIEESWFKLFPVLSGLFFLPVLLYSAQPFFKNSYYALKAKRLSIDTPIALAILGGSILSYIKFFSSNSKLNGEIYFDSISMFVFLLLFSRYLIFKIQNKYLSPIKVEDVYSQNSVQVDLAGQVQTKPIDDVKVGDLVIVEKNEFVPLDGELVSGDGLVSDAFFSGEFLPKEKKQFDVLFAGSKNLSQAFKIKVTKDSHNTRLSEIVFKLNESLNQKTEITTMADKGSYYLTLSVITVSFLLFAYYSFFDLQEGLSRILALLVVACPCGLAIAIPLIQTLALKKGLKKSLLIKKPSVLEKILSLQAIIFDKTGTLTSGEMRVLSMTPRSPTDLERKILYNLEKESEHPVAKAILKWTGLQNEISMTHFVEKIGTGVSAEYMGDIYEVRSSKDVVKSSVQFYKNKNLEITILLDDTVAGGSKDLIHFFDSKNIESFILSGDRYIFAQQMGSLLGISLENIYAPLSPEQKATFVKELNVSSMYLGDGVNDSIAMSHSAVSVSMESSANVAFKSSDVHILSGGLLTIKGLFEISEQYISAVKYTAALSFMYNLVFSTFAILGFVDPLVAVILMPISSLTITFLAIYLMSKENFISNDTENKNSNLSKINTNFKFVPEEV